MSPVRGFLVILVAALFVPRNDGAVASGSLRQQILDDHNDYRRKQGASNMTKLEWSDSLAQQANTWATRCVFEHEIIAGRGENLAFSSWDKPLSDHATEMMKAWYDEIYQYTYSTNGCGYACHYVQMVWHKNTKVGCAFSTCSYLMSMGTPVANAKYFVCFYDSVSMYGEYPYERGAACSNCPDDAGTCDNRLCVTRSSTGSASGSGSTNGGSSSGGGSSGGAAGSCVDSDTGCQGWAKAGECQRNPWMITNCKKACGVCGGSSGGGGTSGGAAGSCVDSDTGCQGWANGGECQRNPWMITNCKKACGVCGGSSGGGSTSGSGSTDEGGSTGGNSGGGGDACVDDNTKCGYWQRRDMCGKKYIQKSCRKSCGLCSTGGELCNDDNTKCAYWLRQGKCEQKYVRNRCQKTCGLCTGGP